MNLEIVIACDHAGFEMKEFIIKNFCSINQDIKFIDCGTNSCDSVDYPDYAYSVVEKMKEDPKRIGILICATGIGMSIAANRFNFIRASFCENTDIVKLARMHNDINVLCIGARIISPIYAMQLIEIFLETKFLHGRHEKRVEKLTSMDFIENTNL